MIIQTIPSLSACWRQLCLFYIFAFLLSACNASRHTNTINSGEDTMGISITQQEFDQFIQDYLQKMEAGSPKFSTDELVTMTRIWNTIESQHLNDQNDLYAKFCTAYYPTFFKDACEKTSAVLSKGMAMYSESYDLWLGGAPHENSQYRILK